MNSFGSAIANTQDAAEVSAFPLMIGAIRLSVTASS
jgi:hypothetical protein